MSNVAPFHIVTDVDDRPEIRLTLDANTTTQKAVDALANDPDIYQRAGSLVHVIEQGGSPGMPASFVIRDLPRETLRVRLAEVARFMQEKRNGWKRVAPPAEIVNAVHAQGEWRPIRPLLGVITAPTIRADGTLLQTPGYDDATALLYIPSEEFISVHDEVTLEDAQNAAACILDVVCDFPFATDHDRSAWLAGVLTLVGRHAIDGPCPLFAVDANTRGSGKSRLVDVAAKLAHGMKAPRSSLSEKDEEMRKQITSLLQEGSPLALVDNVRGGAKLGSAALDALLTSDVWKDRNLGKIQTLTLPARLVWWASGNNLRFAGDLPRRTLRIRLETPLEDPEDREDFKHGKGDALLAYVGSKRRYLVAQALTVLRAHARAGRPECGPSWGSFESWSRIVASSIRWLGLPDPLLARATQDEGADEERLHASAAISFLLDMRRSMTAREIVAELYPAESFEPGAPPARDLFPSFAPAREALEAATNARGTPDPLRVGHFLKRIHGRVIDGACVHGETDKHRKVQVWTAIKKG